MSTYDTIIQEICKDPDADMAFHNLTELDEEAIPALIRAFQNEKDTHRKTWLLQAIAEFQKPLYAFYKECLLHSEKPIWNESITALCMLNSVEAENLLSDVHRILQTSKIESTKREYILEAIDMIRDERTGGLD